MKLSAEANIDSQDIVRALLDITNTNLPPTDPFAFAKYLELTVEILDDFGKYDIEEPNVRAFLCPSKRLIGILKKLTQKQQRFSILHEIGHFVLPGHASHPSLLKDGKTIRDSSRNLSIGSVITQEIEANQFAADCLFQLERFDNRVHSENLEWSNIWRASEDYEASFEATARRWVEKSYEDCALVVFQPVSKTIPLSSLEIMYTITSPSFRKRYFTMLPVGYEMGEDTPVFALHYNLQGDTDTIFTVNTGINSFDFNVHLFSNSYRVFGLMTPM